MSRGGESVSRGGEAMSHGGELVNSVNYDKKSIMKRSR